jgi:hypothetical protein
MRAVARLVFTYFTCSRLLMFFAVAGLVLFAVSGPAVHFGAIGVEISGTLFLAQLSLFVGSALMPLQFGRLARSHIIRVLPYGRLKLLISAYVTVLIVASPAPWVVYYAYASATIPAKATPVQIAKMLEYSEQVGWLTLTSTVLTACWLYLALYFFTTQRSVAGLVKGLLVVLILILGPTRKLQELSFTMAGSLTQIGVTWLVFGAGFLLWPRWKAYSARFRFAPADRLGEFLRRQIAGREIDLMLGTANPWLLTFAQVVPITIASTIGFYSAAVWLFYLTIFSTVAGAIAGQAAERSRSLWLRGRWTRAELFLQVERSFWRHNSFVLGVLIALMIGIGSYAALPASLLAAGLPLLALGTILSTYLGLMITRGLRWLDAILAMAVMIALMLVAVLAARSDDPEANYLPAVAALEVGLALLALVFRAMAKRRWLRIDWTQCRPERALSTRGAA